MKTERPGDVLDPISGIAVEVSRTEGAGPLLDRDGRTPVSPGISDVAENLPSA